MKKKNLINLIIVSASLITITCFIIVAKNFEEKQVVNLYEKVLKLDKIKLSYEIETDEENKFLIKQLNLFNDFLQIGTPNHKQFASQEFLILKLSIDKCKIKNFSFIIKYITSPNSKKKRLNFSRLVKIETAKLLEGNFIMFPVYHTKKDNDEGYFEGILINKKELNCIENIYKLNNVKDLDLKSFSFFGLQSPTFFKNYLTKSTKNRSFEMQSMKNINVSNITYSKTKLKKEKPWKFHFRDKRICKINNCEYINVCQKRRDSAVRSYTPETVCSIDNDLVIFQLDKLYKKNKIILEGKLVAGQIKINLFNDNDFFKNQLINKKGKFFQIFEIPSNGSFKLTFSNNINLYDYSEVNFVIDKLFITN